MDTGLKLRLEITTKKFKFLMGILYILTKPNDTGGVISELQGNFAVRAFGSWGSFTKLAQLGSTMIPDAVLVRLPIHKYKIDPVDQYIGDCFPEALKIFFSPNDMMSLLQKPGRFVFDHKTETMRLSATIKRLLDLKKGDRDIMSYKDLRMDNECLLVTHTESGYEGRLTLKEGQLLRYFLKNTERLVEREELIDAVWNKVKVSPRTIDSQISKLRRHLKPMSVSIESVYGGGYVLK